MGIIFFFVDGLGLGPPDYGQNPLATARTPVLRSLLNGPLVMGGVVSGSPASLKAIDAGLGVPGLPQSATGQTALLTGVNAPALVGGHVGGFPTRPLRDMLARHSIYLSLKAAGRTVDFANAFTPGYFEHVQNGKWKHSVTTVAALSAQVPIHMADDIVAGQAVYQDLTGERLIAGGHDVPLLTPRLAGESLGRIAGCHDFVLFEFFQTDIAGHSGDRERAHRTIEALDQCLGGLCETLPAANTLLICSDHGNVEDMSSRTHTANPVPFLVYGPGKDDIEDVAAISGVTPWIVRRLQGEREKHEQ